MSSLTPIADSARAYIDEALKTVPDGKRGAIVAYADEQGAGMIFAVKAGQHWTFEAHAALEPDMDVTYGAAVRFAW